MKLVLQFKLFRVTFGTVGTENSAWIRKRTMYAGPGIYWSGALQLEETAVDRLTAAAHGVEHGRPLRKLPLPLSHHLSDDVISFLIQLLSEFYASLYRRENIVTVYFASYITCSEI